ncbi:hypothetical protein [Sporosarcina sp. D27]|uniref:hypothetical protein n=1 Tax=Sporosarcina sp. D27 TaxID=1382305 RepID=UPI00046F0A7C|nr:hypothetical protein [Sporosarcina sp. D27]
MKENNLIRLHEDKIDKLSNYFLENYNDVTYIDVEEDNQLKNLVEKMEGSFFGIGVECTEDFHKYLLEAMKSIQPTSVIKRKRLIYSYFLVRRQDLLVEDDLFHLFRLLAEMNDFVFLTVEPCLNGTFYHIDERILQVNTKFAKAFITFDYDGDGLIVIE